MLAGVIFYRFFRVLVKNENGNRTTNMEVITVPTLFVIYRFWPKIPDDIIIQFFFLYPHSCILVQFEPDSLHVYVNLYMNSNICLLVKNERNIFKDLTYHFYVQYITFFHYALSITALFASLKR